MTVAAATASQPPGFHPPPVTTMGGSTGQSSSVSAQTVDALHLQATVVQTDAAASVDPRFVLPKCELPPRKDFEPIENFVVKAVREQHQVKDDTQPLKLYRGIIEALRFKSDLPLLTQILLALRTNRNTIHWLTHVSNQHARLVHQIVRFNPFQVPAPKGDNAASSSAATEQDFRLADAHLSLLVALVSANSVFLVPAVTALWKLLAKPHAEKPQQTQRLHAALATMLRLVPKGKMEIFGVMASNAPFRTKPQSELTWYYKQCLYVLEYVPGIEGQVLELIIDKSLEMDVEIKIQDGGEVLIEKDEDDVVEDVFQLDLDDDGESPTPKKKTQQTKDVTVDEMADKLDSLMLQLFEFMDHRIRLDPSHAYTLYHVLSRAFESSILITHKSKFVQFLILHLCGLEASSGGDDPLYREFAAKLIDVLLDPYRATSTRQAAACYLASFVSRAAYVYPETICEAVAALLRWCEAYMESLGRYAIHAADARNQSSFHALFYTVSQAAFYIICFRGVEAVTFFREKVGEYEEPKQIDLSAERWTRLGGHALQPLRYCLESVRSEFLAVSKAVQLVNPDVLEALLQEDQGLATAGRRRRKRVSKIRTAATMEKERRTGGVGGLGQGTNPLDSFFPFDPYLLHRSNAFVEPFYSHWKGPVVHDSEEMEDENVDDEMDQDEEETPHSPNLLEGDDHSSSSDSSDTVDNMRRNDNFGGDPMSLGSQGQSFMMMEKPPPAGGTIEAKREALHEAWTAEHNRARAPSIENGSW